MQSLRAARRSRLMSIRELAYRAGVSNVTVQKAERGEPLRLSTIRKIAAALEVEPLAIAEFRAIIESESRPPAPNDAPG